MMRQTRDWKSMQEMSARLLEERTGADTATWNKRIKREGFKDEKSLRVWLTEQGVAGYAQNYLVMERFGYPDFLVASAEQLVDAQYADRPQLRPIYDAIVDATSGFGEVVVQARKTYVSLMTPKRTFSRIQPTTKTRLDLALRLEGQKPRGRLKPSKIQETMPVQIGLESVDDLDAHVLRLLQRAYEENL
jgi:hypothetical protein